MGDALQFAQLGKKHQKAKPLRGVGSGVFEVAARYDTNTYRAVYTVKIGENIYVLHVFQKKSTHGIRTPKKEIDLIIVNCKNKKTLSPPVGAVLRRTRPDAICIPNRTGFGMSH